MAPIFSIIVPVLNEAGRINELIGHVCAIDTAGNAEIIVIDGDRSGSTIKALRDNKVVKAVSSRGRARQMNYGAALASGTILVFLHADTLLPKNAFAYIAEAMRDQLVVGGAFDLGLDTKRRIFRITEQYVSFRTRVTRIPFGDQAIFLRKEYFKTIGGYQDIPLMEDVEIMSRIKKRRDRICIIPEKVRTSPRRWEEEGILYCTVRNMTLQILFAMGVSPERLVAWYK